MPASRNDPCRRPDLPASGRPGAVVRFPDYEVSMNDVLIVGAGIGGLTTALYLHRLGIPCRVIEAVPEIRPLGVGINLLPHAMKELGDLGLQPALEPIAVERSEERR